MAHVEILQCGAFWEVFILNDYDTSVVITCLILLVIINIVNMAINILIYGATL